MYILDTNPLKMSVSGSFVSNSWWPWIVAARLPCPWDSPGKNTGVVAMPSSRWFFLTQESNPGLLHRRQILYIWATREAPVPYQSLIICLRTSSVWWVLDHLMEWIHLGERCCLLAAPCGLSYPRAYGGPLPWTGSSSCPCIGRRSLNYWTTREVPAMF